ncbi:MAG: tRNA 2-thiouridine(34) synthase MnmA [Tissierellia bacterium]|nr:tRNA 2-thiouridine(34) synthase MnmA [Tissierellia bacterium]
MSRILVAMSGGVDSSVVAYLLKEAGHEVVGVTMKLFASEDLNLGEHSCCSLDDISDARMVAQRLGMDYHVYDFSDRFQEEVMDPFVAAYEAGYTPNPCIACNRHLKFDQLYQQAQELNCEFIATGHYAQVEEVEGRYRLKKGLDSKKDQSYVLYSLTQEQLAHTLFPLGGMEKEEVREIAAAAGLINAKKQDSQDICFVPDGDYKGFLERYTGKEYSPGKVLDTEGNVLGSHGGAVGYTIGQRKGLGIATGYPAYVVAKDMEKNTVTLGTKRELENTGLWARDVRWLSIGKPQEPIEVLAKTRYHGPETPATLTVHGDQVHLHFHDIHSAVTPGQAVVFYGGAEGREVLGGGTITKGE